MKTKLLKDKGILFGLSIIIALFLCAAAAPLLAPYDPYETDLRPEAILKPPSAQHPLGTDDLGRDLLSRMLYGARISLSVGLIAVVISLSIGVSLGAIAGYYGGIPDLILMRIVEIMLCFPTIFLVLMIITFVGPSILNVMVVIGLTSWPGLARLVRAEFLTLKTRDYCLAARLDGAENLRIIFRHILPNAMAPIFVSAILGVAGAVLTESALSFLGLGVQIPTPSWGNILATGKYYLDSAWWLTLIPGLAIFLTVLSYNLLGERLRDMLDPRLRA